jgi:hypothetical protein
MQWSPSRYGRYPSEKHGPVANPPQTKTPRRKPGRNHPSSTLARTLIFDQNDPAPNTQPEQAYHVPTIRSDSPPPHITIIYEKSLAEVFGVLENQTFSSFRNTKSLNPPLNQLAIPNQPNLQEDTTTHNQLPKPIDNTPLILPNSLCHTQTSSSSSSAASSLHSVNLTSPIASSEQSIPRRGAPLSLLDLNQSTQTSDQLSSDSRSPSILRALQTAARFKALWLTTQQMNKENSNPSLANIPTLAPNQPPSPN